MEDPKVVVYEIFKHKEGKAHHMDTDKRDKVRYPNNESFGKWAWCVSTPKNLERHLIRLVGENRSLVEEKPTGEE